MRQAGQVGVLAGAKFRPIAQVKQTIAIQISGDGTAGNIEFHDDRAMVRGIRLDADIGVGVVAIVA